MEFPLLTSRSFLTVPHCPSLLSLPVGFMVQELDEDPFPLPSIPPPFIASSFSYSSWSSPPHCIRCNRGLPLSIFTLAEWSFLLDDLYPTIASGRNPPPFSPRAIFPLELCFLLEVLDTFRPLVLSEGGGLSFSPPLARSDHLVRNRLIFFFPPPDKIRDPPSDFPSPRETALGSPPLGAVILIVGFPGPCPL